MSNFNFEVAKKVYVKTGPKKSRHEKECQILAGMFKSLVSS